MRSERACGASALPPDPRSPIPDPRLSIPDPAALAPLLAWYRRVARPLPWRATRDPYAIWLSETMLQQTRVEAVIPYYRRFLAAFPTVQALARAPLDEVLRLWAGLGYYSRARNLHRAAQQVVRDHGGEFPRTAAALRGLAGVGRYTAAAVASIAFGEPVATLDGNIKRVLARISRVEAPVNSAAATERLWEVAQGWLDAAPARSRGRAGDFNQALMELGATICAPRRPRCGECPVRASCAAAAAGVQEQLPVRVPKAAPRAVEAYAAAIRRGGRYLFVRRAPRGLLGGLWQLPAVEVNGAAIAHDALAAVVQERLGLRISLGTRVASVRHQFTHRTLTLHVHAARIVGGRLRRRPSTWDAAAWVALDVLDEYALATLDRKVVAELPN